MLGCPTRAFEGQSSGFSSIGRAQDVNLGVRGSNPLTCADSEVAEW